MGVGSITSYIASCFEGKCNDYIHVSGMSSRGSRGGGGGAILKH